MDIASYIDQALLKTEVSTADIEYLCREAAAYKFKAVFVNPSFAALAARKLEGTGVRVGTVAGFPLGATTADVKIYEAGIGENSGAQEIDMVANVGAIKSGDWGTVRKEIAGVREALSRDTILKVIIEATLLTVEEKITVAQVVADCGADFVKTSTGMFGQATIEDVGLLFKEVGSRIGVKASGGIRTLADALAMIEAGASRIGTSSGAAIVEAQKKSR
ncbi:MAG: deoxyribose-phosphate aldolase [bacterium]